VRKKVQGHVEVDMGAVHSSGAFGPPVAQACSSGPADMEVTQEAKKPFPLHEVEALLEEHKFADAMMICVRMLDVSDIAGSTMTRICQAWAENESAERRKCEDEKRSLTAQLMDCKERVSMLRRQKEEKEAMLATEKRQQDALEKKIRSLEEQAKENSKVRHDSNRKFPKNFDVVKHLARLECEPLRHCLPSERAVLKKKLLLKWHPDKQPSQQNATFATHVMQSMQNEMEWGE